ncbi:NADP-dependent oxidoreductase [Arthrobacter agilis]|uniref:NADP-dependent oxidoreductase n=1 Tax=Arthrobacter agilis TaxID=37921 RepID=UPI002785DC23|nr:NADP-dependent oxidoreductase [Arthrobacter agilis]MDQ0737030.1 NADPH:quinone reductase-like Zn-dependent oxidoreductase [Arthrobacter agilis]
MKAVFYEQYGDPGVLQYGDQPDPKVGPDSVLVDVRASSVNPVDWKITAGYLDGALPTHFPVIPGWDVAGVVVQPGPSVTEFEAGDEVIGYVRMDTVGLGTFAEQVAAPVRTLARKPRNVSWAEAATMPLAGLTAYQALQAVGAGEGDTVLVHNGAGGVGTYAIQIAKAWGARVLATASEKNHDFLRSLGAEPLTYGDGLAERIREAAPEGLDAVVDFVGGDDRVASLELLKDQARAASVADAEAKDTGGRYIFVRPNPADLLALTELVEAGSVKPVLAETFPLERAADAFRSSIDGHVRGKIAVTVGGQGASGH